MRIIDRIINSQFINNELKHGILAWQEHLANHKHFSKHTIINYLNDLGHFLLFVQSNLHMDLSIDNIQALKTQDWQQWLLHRHCKQFTSTQRAIASIKNFYRFLQKNEFIKQHNCHQILMPKTKHKLPRAISQKDVFKLIDYILQQDKSWIGIRNYAICLLIYGCGLRISEVLQITPKQWQYSQDLIIHGKGRKERLIPVLPAVSKAIQNYLQLCPYTTANNQPIFVGQYGKSLRAEIVQRFIRQARLQLAMGEQITPHTLRHCFATHLLEKDVDLRTIQELMGHQNLSTTQQYTKINATKLTAVYRASHPFARLPHKYQERVDRQDS